MFKFFDRFLENIIAKKYLRMKNKMKADTLRQFLMTYPQTSALEFDELCGRIAKEDVRVYHIVNRSLLRAGITRARYTFFAICIGVFIVIGGINGFDFSNKFIFISPVLMAFVAMIISIATIEITYNQRVKAAYQSVISTYLLEKDPEPSYKSTLYALRALYQEHHASPALQKTLLVASNHTALDIEAGLSGQKPTPFINPCEDGDAQYDVYCAVTPWN